MTTPNQSYLTIACPDRIALRQLPTMPDPCWEWSGSNDEDGYGRIKIKGTMMYVHRVFYQLFVGRLRNLEIAMHRCDNPPCCNPNHLSRGNHADNIADCISKGRNAIGAASGHAKLTDAKVAELRDEYRSGKSGYRIAIEMGMSTSTMQNVLFGRTWVHVPNPCHPRPIIGLRGRK